MRFSPFALLRRDSPHALAVSIVGVKMGDRLLQIGGEQPALFAALAGKVGLTGSATAVDDRHTVAEDVRAAAAEAGVLADVDVTPLSHLRYGHDAFDLVVVTRGVRTLRPEARAACLQEAHRVLRGGGRCILIEPAPRGGLGALVGRASVASVDPQYRAAGGAIPALTAEGFTAVRPLAERGGYTYFEGAKRRP